MGFLNQILTELKQIVLRFFEKLKHRVCVFDIAYQREIGTECLIECQIECANECETKNFSAWWCKLPFYWKVNFSLKFLV